MKVSYSKSNLTAGENLNSHNAVYVSEANTAKLAKADSDTTLPCIGITEYSITTSGIVTIYTNDTLDGFVGLTPGTDYYLSQTVAGDITSTKPESGRIIRLGIALNSTELDIHILNLRGDEEFVQTTDLTESVQDVIGTSLSGINITISYDDGTGITTLSGGISNVVEDTTPQLGGDLDLNGKNINYGAILTSSGTYEGEILTVTVDDASADFGEVLAQAADFNYDLADADAAASSTGLIMTLESGTGSKKVLLQGQICNTAWNWSAGLLYLDDATAGGMTQTPPSDSGDQVIVLGWALSADTIFFRPSLVLVEVA